MEFRRGILDLQLLSRMGMNHEWRTLYYRLFQGDGIKYFGFLCTPFYTHAHSQDDNTNAKW